MPDLRQRIANLSPEKRVLLELRLLKQSATKTPLEGIPRRQTVSPCPLSYAQQRLWFLDQLDMRSPQYNESHAVQLCGALAVEALQQALAALVARHEALRTTFAVIDGQPVQVITESQAVALPVFDLRELPEAVRQAEVQRLLTDESTRPFDLSQDVRLRACLLRLHDAEHILLLVTHHIASDGWSMGVMLRELSTLYTAAALGQPVALAALPIQYADYALWQQQWLQGDILHTQIAYWRQQLAGAATVLDLQLDRPRPARQTHHGALHAFRLPLSLAEALKALCRQEGVTLYILLLAAFQTLLYRYSGQEDILVGSPIAGRTRQETEGLIGFFANTLVMRAQFAKHPTFRELLQQVRAVAIGAYAHQDLPFEKLVEAVQPERDPSRNPLFQVMFALQNSPQQALTLPGLTVRPVPVEKVTAKFDLSLSMTDTAPGLGGVLIYNTDLFEAATTSRLLGHWQTLLTGIVAHLEQSVATLPLLTDPERHRVLAEWANASAAVWSTPCVHDRFTVQAAQTPEAIAVVHVAQQLTYAELNRRANQLAHYLRAHGVGPEVPVAICLERTPEMIVGLLGILKAGGAYVPLDPLSPPERLAGVLQDTQTPILLTQQHLAGHVSQPGLHTLCLDTDWDMIARESAANPVGGATGNQLAYVIYTSGSTGGPKGVMVEHHAFAHYVEAARMAFAITPADRVLQFATLSFDAAIEEIFPCLTQGATLILRTEAMLASIPAFLGACRRWDITVLDLPTAYWHELATQLHPGDFPPALRLVIIGGEQALWERLETWHRQLGHRVQLRNTYGPTEATVVATQCDITSLPDGNSACREVPIGRPLPYVEAYVLDQHLQPVPAGLPGELYLGGAGLARGYLKRPELTAAAFVPHPFRPEPDARLYKTGDIVRYLPDGTLIFRGRHDRQVKLRGFRIELGEIETTLRHHPAIREAVVVAREDSPHEQCLVAYVVLANGQQLPATTLRQFVQAQLPAYMVPAAFVFLETLPLTPNGKVDRRALPRPERSREAAAAEVLAVPRTPMEIHLAEVWQAVLGVEQVSVYDNFFDIGGHSLLSMQVIVQFEQRLGLRLQPRDLMMQTLGQLAAMCDERSATPQSVAPPPATPKVWQAVKRLLFPRQPS